MKNRKLTKQRNILYKEVLRRHLAMQDNQEFYLCLSLMSSAGKRDCSFILTLVEFILFKPCENETESRPWFSTQTGYPMPYTSKEIKGAQQMILLFCIEMSN